MNLKKCLDRPNERYKIIKLLTYENYSFQLWYFLWSSFLSDKNHKKMYNLRNTLHKEIKNYHVTCIKNTIETSKQDAKLIVKF